jgi:[ribosomal protein S5]-alanine N-acetyltransferase
MAFALIRCAPDGIPIEPVDDLPAELTANCVATADLYRKIGYLEPWVGYVAIADGTPVGGGAFVGPPKDGFVEIAYYTLTASQGNGFAAQTAAGLVAIARAADPAVKLKAFTLMEENPSVRILRKLGFANVGTVQDADAGMVWEWRA